MLADVAEAIERRTGPPHHTEEEVDVLMMVGGASFQVSRKTADWARLERAAKALLEFSRH